MSGLSRMTVWAELVFADVWKPGNCILEHLQTASEFSTLCLTCYRWKKGNIKIQP